jgi:hypothetical protein
VDHDCEQRDLGTCLFRAATPFGSSHMTAQGACSNREIGTKERGVGG